MKIGDIVQVKNITDPVWNRYKNSIGAERYLNHCDKIGKIIRLNKDYIVLDFTMLVVWYEDELELLSKKRQEKLNKINQIL